MNNQEWFDKKYHKEEEKIVIENERFEGQLIIEDYPKLKELCLQNVKSISKVTLKNLPQLQKCTILRCDIWDLVIENCLQLEKLNISNNSLTDLEFLVNLENLEELKLDSNAKLIEILKPYQGDWKAYKKDIQEIFALTEQNNFRGLLKKFWGLKKSCEDLKENIEKQEKQIAQTLQATPFKPQTNS